MIYLTSILQFLKNPKNKNLLIFIGIVIFCLLFLHQCNKTKSLESQIAQQKIEATRIFNNELASHDTVHLIKVNDSTFRAQQLGYELTVKELNSKYSNLMGSFKKEKNKPPVVIIQTEIIIKDSIREVLVLSEKINGKDVLVIPNDTTFFTSDNFRIFNGSIPYKIIYLNTSDSTAADTNTLRSFVKILPSKGAFNLQQHISLNTGLFKDKTTGQVMIKIDTEYPNMKFTKINGALIDSEESKKAARSLRKTFSVGLNAGYGFQFNKTGITNGLQLGIGLNYSPKFLQFGK